MIFFITLWMVTEAGCTEDALSSSEAYMWCWSLDEEISHLKRTFRQNRCSNNDVSCALIPRQSLITRRSQ